VKEPYETPSTTISGTPSACRSRSRSATVRSVEYSGAVSPRMRAHSLTASGVGVAMSELPICACRPGHFSAPDGPVPRWSSMTNR
jgi:hypothetical protein